MRAVQQLQYHEARVLPIDSHIDLPPEKRKIIEQFINDLDEGNFDVGKSKFYNTVSVPSMLAAGRQWGKDIVSSFRGTRLPKFKVTYERDGFRLWRIA
jgi:hypothetical protein